MQRRLSAVRGFFGYLVREGVGGRNPAVDIRAPKAAKRLPGTLDVDQINQLLDIPPATMRSRCATAPSWSSSIRRDCGSPNWSASTSLDVDLADRTVRVLGKGSKTRIVPVGRKACDAIRAWLRERAALAGIE